MAEEEDLQMAQDYENALAETGFGLYNVMLMIISFPIACAIIFATSVMSFVATGAECDLQLTNVQKGMLNAITYIGMIFGGVPWALMSDLGGRKPVIFLTHLLDAIFANLAALSQKTWQILLFKFCTGFCICGGYATFMTYVAELHGKEHRVRIILAIGMSLTLSTLVLPIIAMFMLPTHWSTKILGLKYSSWQLFITCTTIPSIIIAIIFLFMPESPKFNQVKGQGSKALETLQTIFKRNMGKPKDEYPIKDLPEPSEKHFLMRTGLRNMKIMFKREFVLRAFVIFVVEFCVLMCQNTYRLWMPTMFAVSHEVEKYGVSDPSMCTVMDYTVNKSHAIQNKTACVLTISHHSYVDNVWVALVSLAVFFICILIVPRVGPKLLLSISLLLSSCFGFLLYFSPNHVSGVVMSAIYLSVENISSTSLVNAAVAIFPTKIRTTLITATMMVGRFGSSIGNVIFPTLMHLGCFPPICWLGVSGIVAFIFSLLIPSPTDIPFK